MSAQVNVFDDDGKLVATREVLCGNDKLLNNKNVNMEKNKLD